MIRSDVTIKGENISFILEVDFTTHEATGGVIGARRLNRQVEGWLVTSNGTGQHLEVILHFNGLIASDVKLIFQFRTLLSE